MSRKTSNLFFRAALRGSILRWLAPVAVSEGALLSERLFDESELDESEFNGR